MGKRSHRSILLFLALASFPAAAEPLSVKRVGVLPFETAHVGASGMLAGDLFGTFLQRNFPGLAVVERSRLEKLISEQHLDYHSGLVDQATAARLKSILGVDSVVLGRVVAMDIDVQGGGGTLMMAARLVDTSSGRILWAEMRTVSLRPSFLKRVMRGLSSAPPESDALAAGKLMEKAAFELVQDLGGNLSRDAIRPDLAAVSLAAKQAASEASAAACGQVEARVVRLGESILSQEALYWAHRMREEQSLNAAPGMMYGEEHRQRLTTKVIFWLGEKNLPAQSSKELSRIAEVKTEIRDLYSQCLPSRPELAKFIGPPSPAR